MVRNRRLDLHAHMDTHTHRLEKQVASLSRKGPQRALAHSLAILYLIPDNDTHTHTWTHIYFPGKSALSI